METDVHKLQVLLSESMEVEVLHDQRVPDIDSGTPRQVDIIVRDLEHNKIIEAHECRAHRTVEDSMWIEQAYGKKRSIQAEKMVLTTTSGFYESAKKKAENLSKEGILIELRELKSFSNEAASLFHSACIKVLYIASIHLDHKLHTIPPKLKLPDDVSFNEICFLHRLSGTEFSSKNLLRTLTTEARLIYQPGQNTYNFNLIERAAESLIVKFPGGLWDVSKIEIKAEIFCNEHLIQSELSAV